MFDTFSLSLSSKFSMFFCWKDRGLAMIPCWYARCHPTTRSEKPKNDRASARRRRACSSMSLTTFVSFARLVLGFSLLIVMKFRLKIHYIFGIFSVCSLSKGSVGCSWSITCLHIQATALRLCGRLPPFQTDHIWRMSGLPCGATTSCLQMQ